MKDKSKIKIEMLRAEHIKPEVRNIHKLPESGIIIKTSTKTFLRQDFYDVLSDPFLDRLNLNLAKLSPKVLNKLESLM